MTNAEIETLARQVLAQALQAAGYESATMQIKEDHLGENAIFVTVRFRPGSEPTPGRTTGAALVSLYDALQARGEHRYPYLVYDYPDDPPPYDDEWDGSEAAE